MEAEQRRRTQIWDDGSGAPEQQQVTTVALPSDAVLQQRTYFSKVLFAYVLGALEWV